MNNQKIILLFSLLFLLLSIFISSKFSSTIWDTCTSATTSWHQIKSFLLPNSPPQRAEVYTVHVEKPKSVGAPSANDTESWHRSFLPSTHLESGKPRLVYSYAHALSGFAAWLTPKEVKAMESMKGFLLAYPDYTLSRHTTRSPRFMGLIKDEPGLWSSSDYGQGIVIGVIDSGVDPSHPSFDDADMPDVPKGWEGKCHFDPPTLCNKKLIGAYGFIKGQRVSPVDISSDGHGTNTASIAAGNFVKDAGVLNEALGTASGIAPLAHLAIYKVFDEDDPITSDIMAAIDQALKDKVDVLSISIGDHEGLPLYKDGIAIQSFRAIDKKTFVSCSAGNDGPSKGTIENDAPWILTVGASTIDRTLQATVELGNRLELVGQTAYQPNDFKPTQRSLVYPGASDKRASLCKPGSLKDVKEKIVICQAEEDAETRLSEGTVVHEAGGAAMVMMNSKEMQFTTFAEPHVLPASQISYADSVKIQEYVKQPNPTATIRFSHTLYGKDPSPIVGYFSARGPSSINGGILKPDIIGPGVNIVAATPHQVGPSSPIPSASKFDMVYGTSISAPHLAGMAALLKAKYKDWTPAAIKSAMMTTADTVNSDKKPITDETNSRASLFAIGAGHVNSRKASNPGLVYDINAKEYVPYLCGMYDEKQVKVITGYTDITCSKKVPAEELNYPSFALSMKPKSIKTITRRVTNVGEPKSTYVFKYDMPGEVKVSAEPSMLRFNKQGQQENYNVRFTLSGGIKGRVMEGQLRWETTNHIVKSPVSITIT